MFTIIQSHRTERLVEHLLTAYQAKNQSIFDEFVVIVPSMVLGDWLDKSIASHAGISTLVTTTFWGQYQWELMQTVLAQYNTWLEDNQQPQEILAVPEVAVLTGAVMQWRLFGYFTYYRTQIMADETHPLYPLLSALIDETADSSQQDVRLWSLATDFSRVFGRYLTHREAWLAGWSHDEPVDVEAMIIAKDELTELFDAHAGKTPEWLVTHYVELEAAQRHLWQLLFAAVYEHRAAIETRFWYIMDDVDGCRSRSGIVLSEILPTQLHIFTIQQLPQNELDFLQRLSQHIDITLLHYNPSQLFWADIVDKQWLQRQQVINPESVFLRDYGHTLLSRLGKQSRETFAMLASLSGNENSSGFVLDWQDKFEVDQDDEYSGQPRSLLEHLQYDILMLDESATQQATAGRVSAALGAQLALDLDDSPNEQNSLSKNDANEHWYSDDQLANKHLEQPRHWQLSQYDNSLSIHSCHNLQRQLEILRSMIGRWLNECNEDGSARHLSDVVVLLPDVERHHDLINSVFVAGEGQDGLTLPAKVTGVVDKSIRQLWEAISGFYTLLGSDTARFEAATVLDWLMLPPLYESLGLTHEQMSRACELLLQAGFVRGFDEAHLQQSLDGQDYDYRFSFAYALDQIALGLVMPEAGISECLYPANWRAETLPEKTVPIAAIALADAPIIEALCRVHAGLHACRDTYQARHRAEKWLELIEDTIIHPYFGELDQTRPMRAIFNAMNGFKSSLRANRHYQRYHAKNAPDSVGSDVLSRAQVEAKLSQVSSLPLKLSFMLDSIEAELESQQVSAEPTGVITFGRFGALRNVPFGLVVMLNMDLSEFPNRDRDNRYDLMKAGLAQRGDRFSEDDDNGAFLDALLCARNACWIFYNGQRLTDTHEHLPANPVSELLQFLQGEVQWQWQPLQDAQQSDANKNNTAEAVNNEAVMNAQVQRYLPKLIEQWLVTRHPALPFAEEVFVMPNRIHEPSDTAQSLIPMLEQAMQREKIYQKSTYAPAPVWSDVFAHLEQGSTASTRQKVKLPSKAAYAAIAQRISSSEAPDDDMDIVHVDMRYLYLQVRHPAKHFLKEQQVHIVLPAEDTVYQEPLSLSGLSAYTINDQLLSSLYTRVNRRDDTQPRGNDDAAALLYHPVMPAGVSRQSTLAYQQLNVAEQGRSFANTLATIGINVAADTTSETSETSDTSDILDGDMLSTLAAPLSILTPCAEKMVTIPAPDMNLQGQLQIKGNIPSEQDEPAKLWLNILPNSARAAHLLRFWLAHVYWQVARQTTALQVANDDGKSIWRFYKASSENSKYKDITTFSLAPIVYEDAVAELLKWVRFAHIAGMTPLTMLPVYALQYLNKMESAKEGSPYQPKRADFSDWLWPSYGSDVIYDTCAQHELWQYLLQQQDAYRALSDGLTTLAEPLFGMMYAALTPLK